MFPEREVWRQIRTKSTDVLNKAIDSEGQCQCGRGRPPAEELKEIRRVFDLPVMEEGTADSVYYSLGSLRNEERGAGVGTSHGQGHTWLCV